MDIIRSNSTGMIINIFIILLGLAIFFYILKIGIGFSKIKRNLYSQPSSKTSTRADKKGVNYDTNINDRLSIDKYRDCRKEFNDKMPPYLVLTQSISIFPLLGLFGTVTGLIPGLGSINSGDLTVLYNSLSTALFSTFWGLLVAIILKLETSVISKSIYAIELRLESMEKDINIEASANSLKAEE